MTCCENEFTLKKIILPPIFNNAEIYCLAISNIYCHFHGSSYITSSTPEGTWDTGSKTLLRNLWCSMMTKPLLHNWIVCRDRKATDDRDFWLWRSHYWIIVRVWQSKANIHRRDGGEVWWVEDWVGADRESYRGSGGKQAFPVTICSLLESINPTICVMHTVLLLPLHQRSSVLTHTHTHTQIGTQTYTYTDGHDTLNVFHPS